MASLIDFAETDKQKQAIEVYERVGGSVRKAAREIGVDDKTVWSYYHSVVYGIYQKELT
jgi:molybdenum-dependent DNA-binding transcriptional regulator ModE